MTLSNHAVDWKRRGQPPPSLSPVVIISIVFVFVIVVAHRCHRPCRRRRFLCLHRRRRRRRRHRRGGGSSGGSSGEKKQGRGAEGTCHQACAISGQPVVPPERRLLWRTAPTATKIHRPSPNCAAGCGRITSCRGVHRGGGGRERASEMNNIK